MKEDFWKEVGLSESEYELIKEILQREPNEVELGMFGVMWSEHCSYKNSRNVLKQFPTEAPWVLQGPGENAGVIERGDGQAGAFKIESHNHPSAIEPYQGAATGVGGIIRDIFTMGARPIASLNSLRFGSLKSKKTQYLLVGCIRYRRLWQSDRVPTVAGKYIFIPLMKIIVWSTL